MEIAAVTGFSDGYSASSKEARATIGIDEFKTRIIDLTDQAWFVVNSVVVRRGWWREPDHLLLLDCDGTGEMLATCSMLKKLVTGYALIQSSPSRYWVVVDKVGCFRDLYKFACCIPGVDGGYLATSLSRHSFFLRATPAKPSNQIAGGGPQKALFESPDGLCNQIARRWYEDFEKLWNLPEVNQRYQAEVLSHQLAEGTIISAAANPEFQL